MKNILKIISVSLIAILMLCGCEDINNESQSGEGYESPEQVSSGDDKNDSSEEKTEPGSKPAETSSETDSTEPTEEIDGKFVYDNAEVLSKKDYTSINRYAARITAKYKIKCAVVTVSDLGKKTAEEYAGECYKKLYGNSNGVLFLINNATGNDYILRRGAPSNFITDSDVQLILSEISPMLVTEKYADAVDTVFERFEDSLPEFAIDRTNKLTKEEIEKVNSMLSGASVQNENLYMIFIGNIGDTKIADYAKKQSNDYAVLSATSESYAMMIVNIETAEYYITGCGGVNGVTLQDAEKNQGNIKKQIAACLETIDGENSFDYSAAADCFIKFMNK